MMDQDLIKKRQREMSKQQAIYVAARERGGNREQSAIMAGYAAGQDAGKQVERSELVQVELAKARTEMADAAGITRQEVLDGMKEAADMARVMADPQAMVRAWSEIGKLLGFYAPEVKKHLHGLDSESRDAIRKLDDAQLHKLAKGRVIDNGTQEVVNE